MAKCQRILQAEGGNILDRVSKDPFISVLLVAHSGYRQASAEPIFRGRKLVLNYTGGSPCDDRKPLRRAPRREKEKDDDDEDEDDEGDKRKQGEDEDTDDDRADKKKSTDDSKGRRKSTLLSLTCDRESLAAKAHVSFIGASPDECTYFFEVKSIAACGGVIQDTQQTLGPGGVFGVT